MKNKLTHNLTHNLGLKILALVFSIGLWFVVNNITDPVIRKSFTSVPVEITNADMITNEGKVYEIQDETDSVSVTVRGKSSIVSSLNKEDIKAVADMSDLSFMNTVTIKLSCTRSNYNSQLELSSSVENLKLTIEDMKRTQFVINTNISGEPADGYVVGTVTPSQNVVRVSGPESIINQIDHVDATVDIRDTYTSDITTSVELKFHDENHNEIKSSSIKTNISAINVVVTILATKEVPLKFAVTGEPASGYLTTGSVVSVPETITIAGRKSVLDNVSEILIADSSLSVEDATEDITRIISAKKYLPFGTQFADSTFNGNVSVTVGVEPEASKEEISESIRQIRSLCAAYKEKYNKNYFLLNLMTGTAQDCEISERAARLHIRAVKPRYLFLLESPKKMDETVTEVLKQLFPFQEKIYIVPVNEFQLALLYPVKDGCTSEDIHNLAHTMIDTLSMEALTHVQIAYSDLIPDLHSLSSAYKQTALALRVGKLFYSEQSVFPFNTNKIFLQNGITE